VRWYDLAFGLLPQRVVSEGRTEREELICHAAPPSTVTRSVLGVDHLPTSAAGVTVVQRDHHRQRARYPGDAVGQAERRQRRRPVLLPGLVGEPAHRLHQRAEGPPLRVGTGLAETSHPQHHQPRVDGE
jgi:hypothetical protein